MHARHILILPLLFLLAACGESNVRPNESDAGKVTSRTGKQAVVQKRGGGYYKDDGPADEIPDNLDSLPDAEPRVEPLNRFTNRPYAVLGKSYTPNTHVQAFKQRGIASWYGKKFHGQKTSIGEPYDMFAMTAAHPTLALPSYVRVTRVENGRSVVVRVIDRGPFHSDRVIDLSYAAAHRLGYVNRGSTLVDVEAITPDMMLAQANTKPAEPSRTGDKLTVLSAADATQATPAGPLSSTNAAPTRGLFLQLGAFSSASNADNFKAHIVRELDWLTDPVQIANYGGMYRVHLGPYKERSEAEKVAQKINSEFGYKPGFIER